MVEELKKRLVFHNIENNTKTHLRSMTIKELEDKLKINQNMGNKPSDILFFTGSGISAADPCAFPLGKELHRILLQYYTDMTNLEIDDYLYQNLVSFDKTVDVFLTEYGKIDYKKRTISPVKRYFYI